MPLGWQPMVAWFKNFAGTVDPKSLLEAGVTVSRYADELQLLASAAALHAIETSGLPPEMENEVAAGLFQSLREQQSPSREFLLQNVDQATETYAQAWQSDQESNPTQIDLTFLEEELGERLLMLGENNEVRGHACVRLCLVSPKVLWPSKYKTAKVMLVKAGLLKEAQ